MRKAIIALGASATIALAGMGVAVSNNFNGVKVPMAGEETEIIEVSYTPEEVVEQEEIVEQESTFEEVVPNWENIEPRVANLMRYAYESESPTFKEAMRIYFAEEFERFGEIDCGDNAEECLIAIRRGDFRQQAWFNNSQFQKFYTIFNNALVAYGKI